MASTDTDASASSTENVAELRGTDFRYNPNIRQIPDHIRQRVGDDTDWDQILNESLQNAGAPDDFELGELDQRFERAEDYMIWKLAVADYLQAKNLHKFIDADIRRPSRSELVCEGRSWATKSIKILDWLKSTTAIEVQDSISASGRYVFADEWIAAADKIFEDDSGLLSRLNVELRQRIASQQPYSGSRAKRYCMTCGRFDALLGDILIQRELATRGDESGSSVLSCSEED